MHSRHKAELKISPDQGDMAQLVQLWFSSVQFISVAQSCPPLCNPMDCSKPGLPVHCQFPELVQTHGHRVGDAIQPSSPLSPLLLLSSIFPSIRVFSNELVLCIRWPEYWSFSFNISPPSEYSRLISFKIDWLALLSSPRDSQETSLAPQFKSINSLALSFLYRPTLTSLQDYWKNHTPSQICRCLRDKCLPLYATEML